jgi:hypothetical protein
MGFGGARRGGPKGEKGCGKLLTPHTAFGISLIDGLVGNWITMGLGPGGL